MLNIAVWAGMALTGEAISNQVFAQLGLVPARLMGAALASGAWLPPAITLATALFVHGGWAHLLMNALFLIVVAPPVEALLGSRQYVALYLIGGLAGNIAQTLAQPTSLVPVIGASGAISAVFGAYLMRFADRSRFARAGSASDAAAAARFALAWGALQALVAFAVPGLGIAVWAHVGGFLVGLAAGATPSASARRARS